MGAVVEERREDGMGELIEEGCSKVRFKGLSLSIVHASC
jgi:hypothetical protein